MPQRHGELLVTVGLADSQDPDEIDEATLSLRRALGGVPHVLVRDAQDGTPAPQGAKGPILELGTLAITLLGARPGTRALVDAFRVWMSRSDNRKITLRLGDDRLDLSGLSSEEASALVERFLQDAPRRPGDSGERES